MTTTSSKTPRITTRTDNLGRNNGPVDFADQLYQARKAAGLSIRAAAKRVGVSPRTWSFCEAGIQTLPDEASAITREQLLARLAGQRTDNLGRNNGPVDFADQLCQARRLAGLSIPAAAKRVGVSQRTWSYWEAGTRTPPDEASAITRERVLALLHHYCPK